MLSKERLEPIVTEQFITSRKINISLIFIKKSHFAVPKNIRLNSAFLFYENSKNARASTNCNHSYIHILILKT